MDEAVPQRPPENRLSTPKAAAQEDFQQQRLLCGRSQTLGISDRPAETAPFLTFLEAVKNTTEILVVDIQETKTKTTFNLKGAGVFQNFDADILEKWKDV